MRGLFPFDGGGGFARYVVDDSVYASDFVDDSIGDQAQHFVGNLREIGGHEIDRLYSADCDDAFVASLIAHDAYCGDGEQYGQGL